MQIFSGLVPRGGSVVLADVTGTMSFYVSPTFIFALACVAVTMWAIVSVLRTDFYSTSTRILWLLIVVLTNLLGAIVWLAWGRKKHTVTF